MMKKRVELSTYCWIISALSTAFICGVFLYALQRPDNNLAVWISGAVIIMLFFSTLCYMPLSISLDSGSLNINRPLKFPCRILRKSDCVHLQWEQKGYAAAADGLAGMAGLGRKTSASILPITAKPPTASSSRLKAVRNICSAARMHTKWSMQ